MNEHKKSGKLLKRLLVVCLCLVMALGSAVTIIAASFDGDLNGDGKVTALDAQMLAEYEAGLRDLDLSDKIGLTVKSIIDWILGRAESEPNLDEGIEAVVEVKTENGEVTKEVSFTDGILSVTVREGTKVTDETLTVSVKKLTASESDVALEEGQELLPLDIHVEGVAADNTTPIIIGVAGALDAAMNEGNLELYHVENGVAQPMNQVESAEALSAHNDFYYDPANGDITVSMATFSEVAMVSDTDKAWEGHYDYSWYTAHNEALAKRSGNDADYIIANADQLAAFGAIVGGMATYDNDGETVTIAQDTFDGKTVELLADINLGDAEDQNNPDVIFYPIGYYYVADQNGDGDTSDPYSTVYSFEGTFNGKGHTISNFYQNTWEMKGDDSYYDLSQNHYYNDAMGLFGYVVDGVVQNLTVDNFSSDGEFTPTGVIAAYAVNSTFKNIAITNCNPRVYNTGNGGIIGIAGSTSDENAEITLENITVDNTNKISALWGSWDVACGGLVGMFRGNADSNGDATGNAIHFENCHVSAQIDVYNDVCANYQYYAYRYAGMIIGSVRHNTTNTAGQSIPNMAGITAKDCTVNYGTWNDYYYCELVANSIASYTHDYQFSRLEQIASLDEIKSGETWLKTGNFLLIDGNDKTCYHIVKDEEGNLKQHLHTDAGYEKTDINGDGNIDSDVLLENNQIIYLPFDQMFTGYGWGVNSQSIDELDGIMDITMGTQEASVVKFESIAASSYNTGNTVTIGELFKEKEDNTVDIDADNVQVFVSPKEEGIEVGGTYVADTADWTKGTLTFTGDGEATITITDYNFCTPTTINVTITERANEQKFELVFPNTDSYLYRVGNQNTVTLSSLFKQREAYTGTIGNVDVKVENVAGKAAGTYIANTTAWASGTIQFSGTGVVKVTITDDDYCIPTELILQVVDATNATSATHATTKNIVLLQDAIFSTLEVSDGYTLYGNGFTLTCETDSYAADLGYSFVTLDSGILDNVQIVCPNFDYAALYKSNLTSTDNRSYTDSNGKIRYYNAKSGVMVSGNSQILNSRISGARAAVNVTSGNAVIDNSRIEGGAVASILVGAANHLTLRNVTLVQKPTASTYDSNKTLMGFSVLLICNSDGVAAPVTLEGTLIQNAWVDENDSQYVPSAGSPIINNALKQTDYMHDLDGDGTRESLNLGFAFMPESTSSTVQTTTITDNRTNKNEIPYNYASVSSTKVYSYKYSDGETIPAEQTNTAAYKSNKYSDIVAVNYADTAEGLTQSKSFSTSGWIYELNVDLDTISGYELDFSKLTMSVNGVDKNYTVTDADGSAVDTTSTIAVTAGGTTYTLTAAEGDAAYTAVFKVTGTETTKESPSLITANYETALLVGEAGNTLTKDTWHGAAPVLKGIQIRYWSVAEKQYKTISLSDYTPTTAGKQNGTNAEWTYQPTNGDFTLTIKNETAVHSGNSVYAMPVVVNNQLYFVANGSNGLVNYGNSARTIKINYYFKDNNGGTELKFDYTWSIACEDGNTCYDYSDFCNGTSKTFTIKSSNGNICVTGDTLVTLADGSQKRADAVTYEDQLLVWNFFTGEYDAAPAAILFNHGEELREVLKLTFDDGTSVKVVNNHGFFHVNSNGWVFIDKNNAESYIGDKFVKSTVNDYETAKLVGYELLEERTGSYSIQTAMHNNFFVEGMFSITMPEYEGWFDYFEIGDNMKYDEVKMQADIEKYGLYTYEDFAEYVTYEQFIAFNGPYLKVLVGRGVVTREQILGLIENYVKPLN